MDERSQPRAILANGTELKYVERGEGVPVVFVHGSVSDFRSWLEMLMPFAEQYRTLTYSRRGHYPNAWPADYTACVPEDDAADLAALIETLGLEAVHLVGHSYGGLVSLVLASRRPDLIRSLVLGEPPLLPLLAATPEGEALAAEFTANAWEPARSAFHRGDLESGVRLFLDGVIGEGTFDRLPLPVRTVVMDNAQEMRVEVETPEKTFYSTLSCDDLERVRTPVLLLRGELSPPLFRRILDELARCLPMTEQAMIPGVSHDLWNPPVFNETVLGFLGRH
jgi:pimeloyl-ACP methyl ester carboxylesterase